MRLSATDRIIREAQQHDSAAVEATADEHPDTEKVPGAPLLSLGFPSPRMPQPLGDSGFSFDDGDEDSDAYEEGQTQVDAKRSAAALDQMRALQDDGKLTPPPALTRRSGRHHGLPPGRPGGSAALGLVPPLAPLGFPQTMLMFAPAPSMVAPTPSTPPPVATLTPEPSAAPATRLTPTPTTAQAATPAPSFHQPPWQVDVQFEVGPTPTPAPMASGPRRGRVGRRAGFAITAGTAIAVTVILGTWTNRESPPARTGIDHPSSVGSAVVTPVTTAASDSAAGQPSGTTLAVAPPAPVAQPAAAAPVVTPLAPTPALAPLPPPAVAPPALAPPAMASTEASRPVPTPSSKHAQAAARSAKVSKARLAKKKAAAIKRNMHAPRASHGAAGRASGPASRAHSDPDDTLPISD